MNRDEFERLNYKLESFRLLNNFESAKKAKQPNVSNRFVESIFKSICKVLINRDNLKHFNGDEDVTFVLFKSETNVVEHYRKHFDVLYKIFEMQINENNIVYNDDVCEVRYEVI